MVDNVVVGRVVSVWGIRGDLKVLPLVDDPDFFLGRRSLLVRGVDGAPEPRSVERVRIQRGTILLRLSGIGDRNAAEALRGREILVPRTELPPLEEGRFYYFELEGLRVRTADGRELGVLEQIFETGGNDVYVVRAADGREILIPATHEVVRSIDPAAGTMVVDPLEGMLD